ncbi:MAG: efflux RND transporter permease subunit [Chloroflexota bacterium]
MAQRRHKSQLNGVFISDTSIKQPVFITMVMLLIVVVGLLAYRSLPVNLFPDFSLPTISISVPYPGAGPQSVAEQVAQPIETAINTLDGVRTITSNSGTGIAQIIVEFETSVHVDEAEQDIREQINAIRPTLPQDVQDPIYQQFSLDSVPILSLAISDDGSRSPLELRTLIDDDIAPLLQRISGVGAVSTGGGAVEQINVLMDLEKLQAYQVAPSQIVSAIQSANSDISLGSVTADTTEISLRAPSALKSPEDIERVQIINTPYRVGDLATIETGIAEIESYARLNGGDTITLDIVKQAGSNTITVVDNVLAELDEIIAQESLQYTTAFDQSDFVREATRGAIEELIVAVIAAMLVVLVFLRNFRNTIITIAGLPVILIGNFAALQFFDQSINILTLLAMSLSVGLVIDDAIVVRENIFRWLDRGYAPIVAASRGTAQVSLSVVAMTLTIIAVFLPVTFTTGITGIIFAAFGITVACAMAISLFEAFTFAPMLSAYLTGRRKKGVQSTITQAPASDDDVLETDDDDEQLGRLARGYARLLRWGLRRRLVVIGGACIILMASLVIASGLQFAFTPTGDTGEFAVGFELSPGTALDETDRLAREAEQIILQDPAIESVLTTVGGGGFIGISATERAEFFVRIHEGETTATVQQRLREQLSFLPLLAFSAESSGTGGGTAVTGRQIQLSVQTTRPVEELAPILLQLQEQTGGIAGLTDIDTTYKPGRPELQFNLDPSRTGDLGLSNDQIATSVRALIEGERASVLRRDGDDTDIVVRLESQDRADPADLQAITIPTPSGSIPLNAIAEVELASSPSTIRRYNQLNQVIVGANVVDRNIVETQAEIMAGLAAAELPDDVVVGFVGESEQLNEGFESLLIAMGLSILFVYMVLASQFGSFLQPIIIMLAMPFSFIGAFVGLRVVGLELDIFGMIGLIMLLGLVVKNSILLVDFTNKLRDEGIAKHVAIAQAGALRLRPILMTSLSLIAGALPVAIGLGEGSELRRGLSIVIIGGMISSTLLTLLVVPVAYSLLESITRRISKLFGRSNQEDEATPTPVEHEQTMTVAPITEPHQPDDQRPSTGPLATGEQ